MNERNIFDSQAASGNECPRPLFGVEFIYTPNNQTAAGCPPGNIAGLMIAHELLKKELEHGGCHVTGDCSEGELVRGICLFPVDDERAAEILIETVQNSKSLPPCRVAKFDHRELVWRVIFPLGNTRPFAWFSDFNTALIDRFVKRTEPL